MFCEKCGNKIEESSGFCEKCGNRVIQEKSRIKTQSDTSELENKWWYRLMKVAYIFLNIILLPILISVWLENYKTYSGYDKYTYSSIYTNTPGIALWYSFLTLIIYVIVLRLIKITFFYIFFGQKLEWKKEFKKLW